jgi:hypothetical protein
VPGFRTCTLWALKIVEKPHVIAHNLEGACFFVLWFPELYIVRQMCKPNGNNKYRDQCFIFEVYSPDNCNNKVYEKQVGVGQSEIGGESKILGINMHSQIRNKKRCGEEDIYPQEDPMKYFSQYESFVGRLNLPLLLIKKLFDLSNLTTGHKSYINNFWNVFSFFSDFP